MSKILNLLNRVQAEAAARGGAPLQARPAGGRRFSGERASPAAHFRMSENPFADVINPAYYFGTASQRDAGLRMYSSAEEGMALGLVTGAAGTGKTMLTQTLLESLDPARYETILVLVTPGMSKSVMLREILRELGKEKLPVRTTDQLDLLHRAVMDLHAAGRRLVVIIDEAHFLSSGALHTLRTISNLETPEGKLCTVLLFAESGFLRRLQHPSYRSLSSRMYHRVSLDTMTEEETAEYVSYRMMVAGASREVFEPGALRAVHHRAKGVCREVSRLCYLALAEGALRGAQTVTAEIVERV